MAFCKNCGNSISDTAAFCNHCSTPTGISSAPQSLVTQPGAPVVPYQNPVPPAYAPPYAQPYQRPAPKRSILWPIVGTVVAVLVLVVGGLMWVGFNEQHKEAEKLAAEKTAIQQVLNRDDEISNNFKSQTAGLKVESEEDINRYASLAQEVADGEKNNDTSGCPRDFAEAYAKNATAWAEFAGAIKAHPHIPTEQEAYVMGFLKGLKGDETGGAQEFTESMASWRDDVESKNKEIGSTWQEVEKIKAQHGV